MISLEKRPTPSQAWSYLTPLVAVIATMIAGGIMGLFVGAVILALAYRLLVEWLNESEEQSDAPGSEAAQETS